MSIRDLVPWSRRKSSVPVRSEGMDLFLDFQRDINQLFDRFFGGIFPAAFEDFDLPLTGFSPRVDVAETDEEVQVAVELPGMNEKEIEVTLDGEALRIRGEKKSENERKDGQVFRSERYYGAFDRVVPIPCEVEREKVDAEFKNGVLTITLPKTEASRSRRKKIEIRKS